jgi:hypothetical protein
MLAVGVLLAVVSLSGCLGLITGETVTFESSPAAIPGAGTGESDYTLQNASSNTIERPVTVFGVERTVRLTLHRATYTNIPPEAADVAAEDVNRSNLSEDQLPANQSQTEGMDQEQLRESGLSVEPTVVTIASLPDAQVAGISVNPIGQLSNEELIERFAGGAGGPGSGSGSGMRVVDEQEIDYLGDQRTMTVFEGEGSGSSGANSTAGGDSATRFYVVKAPHEGDIVITIAIRPGGATEEGDASALVDTIESIEHPSQPEGS